MAPALGIATTLPAIGTAQAQTAGSEPAWRHALSLFGDVKYPADFKRYDYVNPDAPRAAPCARSRSGHLITSISWLLASKARSQPALN